MAPPFAVHATAIERELMHAYASGQPGFQQDFNLTLQQQAVARLTVADWASGSWTVTLQPMAGGGGSVFPVVGLQQLLMRAFVRWGVAGAVSSALIDYPVSGIVFSVHGSVVELQVRPLDPPVAFLPGTGGQPRVGGFIARAAAAIASSRPLTLTEPSIAATPATLTRAAHAVAYRITGVVRDLADNSVTTVGAAQLDGSGATVSLDRLGGSYPWWGQALPAVAGAMGGGIDLDAWIPLHPSTTAVRLSDPVGATEVCLSWLIYLG